MIYNDLASCVELHTLCGSGIFYHTSSQVDNLWIPTTTIKKKNIFLSLSEEQAKFLPCPPNSDSLLFCLRIELIPVYSGPGFPGVAADNCVLF